MWLEHALYLNHRLTKEHFNSDGVTTNNGGNSSPRLYQLGTMRIASLCKQLTINSFRRMKLPKQGRKRIKRNNLCNHDLV